MTLREGLTIYLLFAGMIVVIMQPAMWEFSLTPQGRINWRAWLAHEGVLVILALGWPIVLVLMLRDMLRPEGR